MIRKIAPKVLPVFERLVKSRKNLRLTNPLYFSDRCGFMGGLLSLDKIRNRYGGKNSRNNRKGARDDSGYCESTSGVLCGIALCLIQCDDAEDDTDNWPNQQSATSQYADYSNYQGRNCQTFSWRACGWIVHLGVHCVSFNTYHYS